MNTALRPFSCTYTPGVPELLQQLKASIAITTYQAGKLIFLSADGNHQLRQLPRDFKRAMGLAVEKDRMAIATENEVVVLRSAPELAITYPNKPAYYNQFYTPRATYYTGSVDLHDIAWDQQQRICAVNTLFSSLVYINDRYSFEPFWQPPFIPGIASADYCHLNGMAMVEGRPKYVSMFGQTATPKGWRKNIESGGIIMDIETNRVIASGLPMPHSPRWFNNTLYCLLSATGELVSIDMQTGHYTIITQHNGFVRGLAQWGDYLFVGLSKARESTSEKRNLPVAAQQMESGIDIVHLPTLTIVDNIRYLNSVEEIYDVQVLPGAGIPGVLNHTTAMHRNALHTPAACYWADSTAQNPLS